ncbi:MAG: hypothetical protein EOR45_31775 [Mesorhizobium sp.]|nr:MAG: hypothetical protein EOR45_31775 [Mesorhizobium sp.]
MHFIRADARHWKPTRDMVLRCRFFAAFPPCDHLAVSGARWFAGKGLHKLSQSVELFAIAAEWAEFFEVPYMIENPVSTISTYWRKPDHTFDPWQFTAWASNDNYSKKTCLWTGGGFVMPAVNAMCQAIDTKRVLNAPRNADRANVRSVTPIGFMRALYAANFAHKLAA